MFSEIRKIVEIAMSQPIIGKNCIENGQPIPNLFVLQAYTSSDPNIPAISKVRLCSLDGSLL